MKCTKALASILVAGTVVLFGCSKQNTPAPVAAGKWDPIKLGLAFEDSSVEIKTVLNQAVQAVRRTQYEQAVAALDGLLADERVNAAQKSAVSNAIQQIKDKANAAAAAPAP
jgi:hypothetical protein